MPLQHFEKLGLTSSGYSVTKYIYAMSQIDLPQWLEKSRLSDLEPIGQADAKVKHGFLSIYASKCDTSRYNKSSVSEQVMIEAAKNFPALPISMLSFAAPRVGNIAFGDELYQMGVKTLRVTLKQDTHVGVEVKVDVRPSPYLKKGLNLIGFHMLETYLHLVDGYIPQ
ncbi:hypothetical protein SASPL_124201 [Salvia splendens]|uniref:Fungal lipase-type domain-containing protein n=1 Tax=Salvia splendens TaxID=180675 RepID=A0A8X8XRS0_SALSN|nr:hypothetical protein SASPL_124201 [Salvia splendens]